MEAVVVAVYVHGITADVQVVSVPTVVRVSTRRPVGTDKTGGDKLTAGVIAQRREEEILTNLAILWLPRYRNNSIILVSITHINTIVVLKF